MNPLLGVVGVIPVVALYAVVQQVTYVGIGVYQLQQLQSLLGVSAVGGDAVDGAANGVVGDNRGAKLGGLSVNTHLGTPAGDGGAGPALCYAAGLVSVLFGLGGSVRVDDASLVPLVEGVQGSLDVRLLQNGNNGSGLVVVANADGQQAGAHVVVLKGNPGGAVLVHGEGSLTLGVLHGGQGVGQGAQVRHGHSLGNGEAGAFGQLLVPNQVLGDGGVLVGGHAVQLAVDLTGIPVILGDGGIQLGAGGLDQLADVGESADVHVVHVGVHVGEQDVVLTTGVHDHVAAVVPVAPGNDLNVQIDADLFFQVGVDLLQPGVVVGGLAVTNGNPGQVDHFAVGSTGGGAGGAGGTGGGATAAACGHAQRHSAGHAQSKCFVELFHVVSPFLFYKVIPNWKTLRKTIP